MFVVYANYVFTKDTRGCSLATICRHKKNNNETSQYCCFFIISILGCDVFMIIVLKCTCTLMYKSYMTARFYFNSRPADI
jgi:hypothetical protein